MKNKIPLYALIVCGGKSERMGMEKCLLNYHGEPQWQYIYDTVKDLCDAVLISCNAQQAILFPSSLPIIIDEPKYDGCGPMTALLTVFKKYKNARLFVIGCDYPFLTKGDLAYLVMEAERMENTAVVFNSESGFYEPLIAIYNPEVALVLNEMFSKSQYSLQALLQNINAGKVFLSVSSTQSLDTPQQYLAAKQFFDDELIKDEQISEGTIR